MVVLKKLIVAVFLIAPLAWAQGPVAPALVPAVGKDLNESIIKVPVASVETAELEVTVFRPPGEGPFPTVLINHGKSVGAPKEQNRARYYSVSREFVRRGFQVVLPMRRGFAGSQGKYFSAGCDMTANAQNQSKDIADVVQWLKTKGMADKRPLILFGQSYGGLASVAASTQPGLQVGFIASFAGGLKSTSVSKPCDWEAGLVEAMRNFGEKSRIPMLWFYGENDTFFSVDLAQKMHTAFTQAGGRAELVTYPAFKQDAHKMFGDPAGFDLWLPKVLERLAALGYSTEPKYVLGTEPRPVASPHAEIDHIESLPLNKPSSKAAYQAFLKRFPPRAFAIGSGGAWGWAAGADEAVKDALSSCQKYSSAPCRLYAVDEDVVWQKQGEVQ